MAAEDQGIMSLPMGSDDAPQSTPSLPLNESYGAVQQGLQNASPQAAADVQRLIASITPQLDQLSDDELQKMLQIVQYLYEGGEAEYAKRLQEAIAAGAIEPGDLPEEFDPEVLSAIGVVLMDALRLREGAAQQPVQEPPVEQFAKGGIAEAARMVAANGRNGDTVLAHITPEEARLLRSRGGMGTRNPKTGLPEYGLFSGIGKAISSAFKGIGNAVKSALKSPVGRILGTVALAAFLGPGALGVSGLGMSTAASLGLASGTITALAGGNLKQVLTAGATAFLAAPGGAVSQYVGAAGITNAAANAAISAGIVGTGAGLLTGQKLSEAVKSGLTAGAMSGLTTGVTQGFGTQIPGQPANMAPVEDAIAKPVNQVLTPGDVAAQVRSGGVGVEATPVQPQTQLSPTPLGPAGTSPVAAGAPDYQAEFYRSIGINPESVSGPNAGPAPTNAQIERSLGIPQAPGRVPGIGESVQKIGGGIGDLVQGKEGAWGTIKQGASDLFMPKSYTAAELQGTEVFQNARAAGASYGEALRQAGEAYNPSTFRSYAPAVGAGLGIMALAGGFNPNKPKPSDLANQLRGTPGLDLINRNPSQYIVQGLPGVQYTPQGGIAGSSAWSPTATMADVRAPTPSYTGGIFGAPMNYANPYFAADGGLASLADGGYPRKTGAISGPGTEKSDSIPAMLSDGEFVMTAKAVRGAGGGSRREGAKKMYALMHQLERNASRG